MLELANRNYLPVEKVDSPFYWMGQLVMSSDSQHLKSIERDILGSAFVTAPHDIQSIWVSSNRQTANVLTMGINLEADDRIQAMIKASGLTLLAMRKAGVGIENITLEDGRLASGAVLAAFVADDPEATIHDHSHSLRLQLEAIFTDMQAQMITHASPATY